MSSEALTTQGNGRSATPALPEDIEKVLLEGDLSRLTSEQRITYYNRTCESLGLNPLTEPFKYIRLNGALRLYATKDSTEQLRKIHGVSLAITDRSVTEGVYVVTAKATTRDGRSDEATGAVDIGNAKGEKKANLLMKAETKAKRRVTLSICGLGMLDESETDAIPGAQKVEPNGVYDQHGRAASAEQAQEAEAQASGVEHNPYKTSVTLPDEDEPTPEPSNRSREPGDFASADEAIERVRQVAENGVVALQQWEQKHAEAISQRFSQDDTNRIANELYRLKDEAQGAEDEAKHEQDESRNVWVQILKEYREKAGISREALAKEIGVTLPTLTRFAKGQTISRQTSAKIAKFVAENGSSQ